MAEDDVRTQRAPIRWRSHEKALAFALLLAVVAAIVLTFRFVASQDAAPERAVSDASSARDGSTSSGARDGTSSGAPTIDASRPRSETRTRDESRAHAKPAAVDRSAHRPDAGARDVASQPSAAVPATDSVTIGRFTVFGEAGADRGRTLGERVAIDGDVAVATAWFGRGAGDRCEAWVFERRDGAWTKTQTLAPPQYAEGFANDVCISGGRIVVAGGYALGTRTLVFRSYVHGAGGAWTMESETPVGDWSSDWVLQGDVLVGCNGSLLSWRFANGAWTKLPTFGSQLGQCAGSWFASNGDTVACFSAPQGNERLTFLRLDDGRPRTNPRGVPLRPEVHNPGALYAGALCRGGAALVTTTGYVTIYERGADGWARTVAGRLPAASSGVLGFRTVAADGDLAVVAAVEPARFVVLQHRPDGWYSTEARPPAKDRADDFRFTNCASVAMSGRAVIAGTLWDDYTGGRIVFFDVTDDDLAAATKVPTADR